MSSRDQILSLFRSKEGEYLSGQEVSQTLNISRAAVWKQVEQLRELGFEIEARRSQGYRLINGPDLLLASDIEKDLGCRLDWAVHCLENTGSTNQDLRHMAEQGAAEGTVLVADRQSAGRGRLGRRWESPAGVNLYCSLLLRPQIPPQQVPQLTFLTAVAAAEALIELYQLPVRVKWPNDLLVEGKKIAGMLNEMSAESEQVHFVLLGLGINLNMTAEQFPADLRYPATSVMLERGATVERLDFVRFLLQRVDDLYRIYLEEGFWAIRRRWEGFSDLLDRDVQVDQNPGIRKGRVVGLDDDGALRLQLEDGQIERILAGDVRVL
ncbi:MAG TPA: biotin--[acetyl-CoA-carboxylase] ligase [Geopsychrobacteraceae bacterium]|nr:biotin--[acetyl-CoA-carboxylase] ligase [Geopsychrobacteraceae bacterium]